MITRSHEAPRYELPGIEFTVHAAPSRGSTQICAWTIAVAPRLQSPEPHTLDADEVFMVVSGSLRMTPDAPPLGAGDAVVVPAGSPIQLVNPTDEPAQAIVVIRAGFAATMAGGVSVGTPPWAQ
jgi:mannose-6-phosphate isomerase-like protein (cupin superfamily)